MGLIFNKNRTSKLSFQAIKNVSQNAGIVTTAGQRKLRDALAGVKSGGVTTKEAHQVVQKLVDEGLHKSKAREVAANLGLTGSAATKFRDRAVSNRTESARAMQSEQPKTTELSKPKQAVGQPIGAFQGPVIMKKAEAKISSGLINFKKTPEISQFQPAPAEEKPKTVHDILNKRRAA